MSKDLIHVLYRTLVNECITKILFSYSSTKIYVVGTLNETVLLSTKTYVKTDG